MKKLSISLLHFVVGIATMHKGGTPFATPDETMGQLSDPAKDFIQSEPVQSLFSDLENLVTDKVEGNNAAMAQDWEKFKQDLLLQVEQLVADKISAAASNVLKTAEPAKN